MKKLAWYKASRALWRRRLAFRERRHRFYHHDSKRPEAERKRLATKWHRLADEARANVQRRNRQIRAKTKRPPIITAGQLGLRFAYVFGAKGAVYRGAGHYTAGHRVADRDQLADEMRADHAYHAGKGWGGLSYEVMIADDGTIGFGNPMDRKAAAVALNNTGMVGICVPGTTGDRMTPECKESIAWLLRNWHTRKVPKAHRLPRPARELRWLPHKRWPSQSTACPGDMERDYLDLW